MRFNHRLTGWLLILVLALGQSALAFTWDPGSFPEGDQRYVLEMRFGAGDEAQLVTMTIDIMAVDGRYDVRTTLQIDQSGLSADELSSSAFGGAALGMFGFGPMVLFGPTFMMLPMMLGQEDIHVREEPIRVMGLGSLYMDSTMETAGLECVVLRLEPDNDPEGVIEFALAEGVPFPCFSRFGSGDGMVEVRLLAVEY